jgi:hypothetical protein
MSIWAGMCPMHRRYEVYTYIRTFSIARYTFLGLKRYNLGTIRTGEYVQDNLFIIYILEPASALLA